MDYFERVQRAVVFIEGKLKEKVTLEEAAKAADFSFFHFHRLFQSMLGQSLCDYIRQRRLTEAALELASTNRRIIDIALDYQFEGQLSFTKSFKKLYKITPGQFRKMKYGLHYAMKLRLSDSYIRHLQKGVVSMEPKIVDKEGFKVIGLRYYGDNKKGEIKEVWEAFNKRGKEVPNTSEHCVAIGLCSMPEENGDPNKFEYVCSLTVKSADKVPEGMVAREVKPHKYAVFTHKGKLDNLADTYKYIYSTWLPKSGFELDSTYDFELYDERFCFGLDNSEFDIYVPIK